MPENKSIAQMHLTRNQVQRREIVSVACEAGDFVLSYPKIHFLTVRECGLIQDQIAILFDVLESQKEGLRRQGSTGYNNRRKLLKSAVAREPD